MLTRWFVLFAGVLFFTGCAALPPQPAHPCQGKETAGEAIMALDAQRAKIIPVRASGQCLLKYNSEGKEHKENFPVKIWTNPPDEIYLQGDVAFDATGLVLGANADEFWFWLKPKEVSTYWWGTLPQAGNFESFAISSELLLEAFGSVSVTQGDWSLTHGRFDILWLHGENGDLLKRVYIEPCHYVVAKIEYLDSAGRIIAVAEFAGHKQIAEGLFVPMRIKIAVFAQDGTGDSAEISLASAGPIKVSEQQRQRLFVRPRPDGFNRVYQVIDGVAVEQRRQ